MRNQLLGSCPECGGNIYSNDIVHKETENLKEVYKCLKCKKLSSKDELIPF